MDKDVAEEVFKRMEQAATRYATECFKKGKHPRSIISGLDANREGHHFDVNYPASQGHEFYSWVKSEFEKNGVIAAIMFGESWRVSAGMGAEAAEVEDFLQHGGSVEFWPGAELSFCIEMTDGEWYKATVYNIVDKELVLVPDLSKDIQLAVDSGAEGPLLRLFEIGEDLL